MSNVECQTSNSLVKPPTDPTTNCPDFFSPNQSCLRKCSMSATPSRADQLEKRLISFAASILSLSSKLPRTPLGRHICTQLLRSGTAAAANYGEARGAESRADFIHKLKVVFKELNETTIWLEIMSDSSLLSPDKIISIVAENRELCRIISASIRTAGGFERC